MIDEEQPPTNISHILDTRLKQIEDENRVAKLREDYAMSKTIQTDEQPTKVCWFPFTLFRNFTSFRHAS